MTLQDAVDSLYRIAVAEGKATSTKRLDGLARFCIDELAKRGLEGAVTEAKFVGDTVLDPFLGTGTTSVAAARTARNSVGVEVDRKYVELARGRFLDEAGGLFERAELELMDGNP